MPHNPFTYFWRLNQWCHDFRGSKRLPKSCLKLARSETSVCNSPLVMTAQTMSFRYELACKGFSGEKAQHLVTQQKDLCCFIGLTFTLSFQLSFLQLPLWINEPTFIRLRLIALTVLFSDGGCQLWHKCSEVVRCCDTLWQRRGKVKIPGKSDIIIE